MTKFSGSVGYVIQAEVRPGVWDTDETVRQMKGDIIKLSSNSQNDDKVNSDVSFNHRVSLLGDAFAFGNYFDIKWIQINGRKLEVTSVEINRPRIVVTVGGMWND